LNGLFLGQSGEHVKRHQSEGTHVAVSMLFMALQGSVGGQTRREKWPAFLPKRPCRAPRRLDGSSTELVAEAAASGGASKT
jgi:hypothetical protein